MRINKSTNLHLIITSKSFFLNKLHEEPKEEDIQKYFGRNKADITYLSLPKPLKYVL